MEEIGSIIRNLADDVPGVMRGAMKKAATPNNGGLPAAANAKGNPNLPGPLKNKSSLPAVKDTDWVQFIDEQVLGNTYVNLGLFAAPMGLGLAAKGVSSLGMHGTANALTSAEKLTFSQLGHITGLGGIAGKISDGVMKGVSLFTKPLHFLGITDAVAATHAASFQKHAWQMDAAAHKVFAYAPGLSSHPQLNSALADVHSVLTSAPMHAMNFERLEEAVTHAKGVADNVGHTALSKALGSLGKEAGRVDTSQFFGHAWKDLEHNTANATAKMANANVWHGLMNATFLAGAGVSDYHTVTDLKKGLESLRAMHASLSGQRVEDVSTMGLLFGKVSQPVGAARAELLKEFGPAAVLDVANTIINVKFISHSKFGSMPRNIALLIALPMANMMIARGLLGGSLLPAYAQVKEAQAKGEQVPPEMYAKLIGNGSQELHHLGGETSNFTKALSIFYAEHQAPADAVLKEVDNGILHKRMVALEKAYQDYIRQHPEKNPELKLAEKQGDITSKQAAKALQHEQEHANGVSHVERLNGKPLERKVIGRQTEKLHQASADGQHATPSPGMA